MAKLDSLSPRDQLSFLYLQFQRTLILWVIQFYEKPDLRLRPQILDERDDQQIAIYLAFCKDLNAKWPVRAANAIHQLLDRSKKFKNFVIHILLHSKSFLRGSKSDSIDQYDKWISQVESVKKLSAHTVRPDFHFVLNAESLTDEFNPEPNLPFIAWGTSEQLSRLDNKIEKRLAGDFQSDIESLTSGTAKWIIFQTEPGQISKLAISAVTDQIKRDDSFFLAYGDGDLVDRNLNRTNPRFYPDWNLRYCVGDNCLRGILVFSCAKLKEFARGRSLTSFLSLLAEIAVSDLLIRHIPRVLFHSRSESLTWQATFDSELSSRLMKLYGATIEKQKSDVANIIWPLPTKLPSVSFLIPTREGVSLVKNLLDGLLNETDYDDIEIVIVDNQSAKPESIAYFESLRANPKIKIVKYDAPFNFSAINNFGFEHCSGEILALLNNDLEIIHPSWLKEMVREALAPKVGIVGAKLFYKSHFIQHAGVIMGSGLVPIHIHALEHRQAEGYRKRLLFPHELSAVTGACMVMRREVFARLKGFNAADLSVAYNDIDLCLRTSEQGLKIVWTPRAELFHLESASRPSDRSPQQIERYRQEVEYMRRRWPSMTKNDPFHNPQLSRNTSKFKLPLDDEVSE